MWSIVGALGSGTDARAFTFRPHSLHLLASRFRRYAIPTASTTFPFSLRFLAGFLGRQVMEQYRDDESPRKEHPQAAHALCLRRRGA